MRADLKVAQASLAALCIAVLTSAASAQIIPGHPLRLEAQEVQALGRLSCVLPHSVSLESAEATMFEAPLRKVATVWCASHATESGYPKKYKMQCAYQGDAWTCDRQSSLEVLVIGNAEVTIAPYYRVLLVDKSVKYRAAGWSNSRIVAGIFDYLITLGDRRLIPPPRQVSPAIPTVHCDLDHLIDLVHAKDTMEELNLRCATSVSGVVDFDLERVCSPSGCAFRLHDVRNSMILY